MCVELSAHVPTSHCYYYYYVVWKDDKVTDKIHWQFYIEKQITRTISVVELEKICKNQKAFFTLLVKYNFVEKAKIPELEEIINYFQRVP